MSSGKLFQTAGAACEKVMTYESQNSFPSCAGMVACGLCSHYMCLFTLCGRAVCVSWRLAADSRWW